MKFEKYQGLGNDFALVEAGDWSERAAASVSRLCDRRVGIGADGVLLLTAPSGDTPASMRVVNADGSEPEMCGNGLRCAARYAIEHWSVATNPILFRTGAGVLEAHWERRGNEFEVRVGMGPARFWTPPGGPLSPSPMGPTALSDLPLPPAIAVDMGNPHAVIFGESTESYARSWGPKVQALPLFPQGVNAGFATKTSEHSLQLTVFERGAGLTAACGTGACAAVAAGVAEGLFAPNEEIEVELPGGKLRIEVEAGYGQIWMTGPAEWVYSGELPIGLLRD